MEGTGPKDFRLDIESGFRVEEGDFPVVSVNPQFPINRHATGLQSPNGSQNILFTELSGGGQKTIDLMSVGRQIEDCIEAIPVIRRLLEFYEYGKDDAFWSFLEHHTGQPRPPQMFPGTIHGTLHMIWTNWISDFIAGLPDPTALAGSMVQISEWHRQSLYNADYCSLLKTSIDNGSSQIMTRRIIGATRSLMNTAPAWRSGYLRNRVADEAKLANLDLLQDEFDRLRDVYQNVFETTCASLWPLVLMRNTVINGSPNDFTGISYTKPNDPKVYQVNTLTQFSKLPNFYKVAVIESFPEMQATMKLLNSRTRNAIGHASAHHDLFSGSITNDEGEKKPYFDFVGEVFALFGPLTLAVTCSRFVAVAGRDESLPAVAEPAP